MIHMRTSGSKLSSFFSSFVRPYLGYIVFLIILSLIAMAFSLIEPLLMRSMIDDVFIGKNTALFWRIIIFILAFYTVSATSNYFSIYMNGKLNAGLSRDVEGEVFYLMQSISMDEIHKIRTGDIMSRVMGDTAVSIQIFTSIIPQFIISLVGIIVPFFIMFYLDKGLTVIAMLPLALFIISSRTYGEKIKARQKKSLEASAAARSFLKESLSILPLVKAFSLKEHMSDKFRTTLDDVYSSSLGYTKTSALYGSLNSLIYSLPTILLLIFGGFGVINGVITIGTLTAFISYTAQFFSPIRTISNLWSQFKSSSASFDRMQEILEMKKDTFGDEELRITEGRVTFKDVRFSYDGCRPVLQGVSFECRKGLNYITGDNGCGKSTLLKLLCGFYLPESGSIMIDGQDIRNVREEDLRKSISILFQDPLLSGTTIYENIAFGKTSATTEQIVKAAELARADDFIRNLSQGYDTPVGEEGADLSGGEKQKIALTRALLKNAPILLLDEVTKSIDAKSKKDIYEVLRALKNDKTILIVTHDSSEVEEGSNVIHIKDGKAVSVVSA